MTTKQIIEQMEKKARRTKDKMDYEDYYEILIDELRSLLESFGEEIIGERKPLPTYRFEKDAPYDIHSAIDLFIKAERETTKELLKDEQRLKVKEIINSIRK